MKQFSKLSRSDLLDRLSKAIGRIDSKKKIESSRFCSPYRMKAPIAIIWKSIELPYIQLKLQREKASLKPETLCGRIKKG